MLMSQALNSRDNSARIRKAPFWGPLLALSLLLASAFMCHSGQAYGQNTAESPKAAHSRKATLPELYAMFFAFAVHIDTVANADEKLGKDRTFYRQHLQRASGLSEEEYAQILASARRFVATDTNLRNQINGIMAVVERPESATPTSVALASKEYRDQMNSFIVESTFSLETEIATVRNFLGQDRADALDAYLQDDYATGRVGPARTQEDEQALWSSQEKLPADGTTAQIRKSQEMTISPQLEVVPSNAVVSSPKNCYDFTDPYGYGVSLCIDGQMSYLGPSDLVELYAGGSGNGGYSSWTVSGALTVTQNLAHEAGVTCSASGTGSSTNADCSASMDFKYGPGAVYTWTGTVTTYYANGQSASNTDPAPPKVDIYQPEIQDLSQTSFSPGSSGTFMISGLGLITAFQNTPTFTNPSGDFNLLSASGFTISGATDTITVSYAIPEAAQTGSTTITLNNGFASETVPITITPPLPSITSATVSGGASATALQAGPTTQTVTLTGQYLDTAAPTISIASGGAGITLGSIVSASQTSVSFQVTVNSDASADTVTFLLTTNGQSALAPSVSIVAMTPPAASITFNGANVTGTTTSVVVGQQVYLSISLADGSDPSTIATSIDWTVPGTVISEYTAFTSLSNVQVVPLTQTEQPSVLFYWVYPGSFSISYKYCVDVNMQSCATVSATFNVIGPTGVDMTATPGPPELFVEDGSPTMSFGNTDYTAGMAFVATMSAPGGQNSAFFVQLINYDNDKGLLEDGSIETINCPNTSPALDGQFPYPLLSTHIPQADPNLSTADVPSAPLDSSLNFEAQRLFSATMYLMWYPTGDLVTPYNNDYQQAMPVPLGFITWTYAGDAINTLQVQNANNKNTTVLNDTTYVFNPCSGCTSPSLTFTPSLASAANYGYPTWAALAQPCSDPNDSTETKRVQKNTVSPHLARGKTAYTAISQPATERIIP